MHFIRAARARRHIGEEHKGTARPVFRRHAMMMTYFSDMCMYVLYWIYLFYIKCTRIRECAELWSHDAAAPDAFDYVLCAWCDEEIKFACWYVV